MEIVKGKKMNSVMYVKWMNQEQQRRQKGFVDLRNGDDNAFTNIKNEGRKKCPNNSCMDVELEEVKSIWSL